MIPGVGAGAATVVLVSSSLPQDAHRGVRDVRSAPQWEQKASGMTSGSAEGAGRRRESAEV